MLCDDIRYNNQFGLAGDSRDGYFKAIGAEAQSFLLPRRVVLFYLETETCRRWEQEVQSKKRWSRRNELRAEAGLGRHGVATALEFREFGIHLLPFFDLIYEKLENDLILHQHLMIFSFCRLLFGFSACCRNHVKLSGRWR